MPEDDAQINWNVWKCDEPLPNAVLVYNGRNKPIIKWKE